MVWQQLHPAQIMFNLIMGQPNTILTDPVGFSMWVINGSSSRSSSDPFAHSYYSKTNVMYTVYL